ncbi:LysE family translocator [Vibrio sp. SS-MA-C1-2]|nr:LysE family translocator [Vibrio sp. SS-MA-C1-2]UJF20131.1 LysE family translocator [Vibrio sp. SS-MA-C1-2]
MDFLTFLVAITLLTMTPGLDTMLVIRNSHRGGTKDGFFTSLGICSGLFIHATLSAVGISVILLNSAILFQGLKFIGALYLIWLGFNSVKSALKQRKSLPAIQPEHQPVTLHHQPVIISRSLREGFLSNVLNPKTAVFYLAFLPQFISPEGSALNQSLFLAGCHFAIAMVWQTAIAFSVEKAKVWLSKPKANAMLEAVTGIVMVLLGIQLAFTK